MRVKIKMFFTGRRLIELHESWNSVASTKANRLIAGAVAIWEDDPDLERFNKLYETLAAGSDLKMEARQAEAVYDEEELYASKVVKVDFGGMTFHTDAATSAGFEVNETCHVCHRAMLLQRGAIRIERIEDNKDALYLFWDGNFGELCVGRSVSVEFKQFIERQSLPGIEFREILHARSGSVRSDIVQLVVNATLPALNSKTKLDCRNVCSACGEPLNIYLSGAKDTRDEELHFPQFDVRHIPIGLTMESFGRNPIKTDGGRELIVRGSIYKDWVTAGFTGLSAIPAHIH